MTTEKAAGTKIWCPFYRCPSYMGVRLEGFDLTFEGGGGGG